MYHQCPGLADEHVPLNETGYLLPLPQVRWAAEVVGAPGCCQGCMHAKERMLHAACPHARLEAAPLSPATPHQRPRHRAPWHTRWQTPIPASPCLQRLVVRTCFVLAITALAVVAPFVMPVVGLVGSVGWFPLTIAFPFLCWIKVGPAWWAH